MRELRTVPQALIEVCADMMTLCPEGDPLLQYVNPMAINTWAIAARYPQIRQVRPVPFRARRSRRTRIRSRHSARDRPAIAPRKSITWLSISPFEQSHSRTGAVRDLYPELLRG